MTSPNPDPNGGENGPDPGGIGSAINNGIAGLIGDNNYANETPAQTLGSLGGAVGSTVLGALGLKTNTFNIILNTLFYGTVTLIGGYLVYRGLRLIAQETPGTAGVGAEIGAAGAAGFAFGSGGVSLGKGTAKVAGKAVGVAKRFVPELRVPAMLAGHSPIQGPTPGP